MISDPGVDLGGRRSPRGPLGIAVLVTLVVALAPGGRTSAEEADVRAKRLTVQVPERVFLYRGAVALEHLDVRVHCRDLRLERTVAGRVKSLSATGAVRLLHDDEGFETLVIADAARWNAEEGWTVEGDVRRWGRTGLVAAARVRIDAGGASHVDEPVPAVPDGAFHEAYATSLDPEAVVRSSPAVDGSPGGWSSTVWLGDDACAGTLAGPTASPPLVYREWPGTIDLQVAPPRPDELTLDLGDPDPAEREARAWVGFWELPPAPPAEGEPAPGWRRFQVRSGLGVGTHAVVLLRDDGCGWIDPDGVRVETVENLPQPAEAGHVDPFAGAEPGPW